jgi:hypothetical protein
LAGFSALALKPPGFYETMAIRYMSRNGGVLMRIELEGSLLRMTPENERERDELNHLWNVVVGCIDEGKKLVPVGEYIPGSREVAVFNIE